MHISSLAWVWKTGISLALSLIVTSLHAQGTDVTFEPDVYILNMPIQADAVPVCIDAITGLLVADCDAAIGTVGPTGPIGAAGAPGVDGKTVLNGVVPPSNNTDGVDGDFYIDTATNILYGPKASGSWPMPGTNLVGPQGDQGSAGADGAIGDSVVMVTEAPGVNCAQGGVSLTVGVTTEYVCNGSTPGATYRWATWSTYDNSGSGSWFAGNDPLLFGGVPPQAWADQSATASNMSSLTRRLRTLFVNKGPDIGTLENATVFSSQWVSPSSTNSRHAAALFRVKNTTAATINWQVNWYGTSNSTFGERSSAALNGVGVYTGTNNTPSQVIATNLSIPPSRTSTVIFIAAASPITPIQSQVFSFTIFLAFTGGTLQLPAGLEFVDDLNTKPDGWNN